MHPSLTFVDKARSLPAQWSHISSLTLVGSSLASKNETWVKVNGSGKHFSSKNYVCKKFYSTGPWFVLKDPTYVSAMNELLFECYSVPKVAYGVDCLLSYYFNKV